MQINGEIKLQSLMSSWTGANGVIFDVGANVGDWSVALIGGLQRSPLNFSSFIEIGYSCINLLIARNDVLSDLTGHIFKR